MLIKNWTLQVASDNPHLGKDVSVPARVPGDITADLYRAGLIPDPYYGMNHKLLEWIPRQDFVYTAVFDADEQSISDEEALLELNGVNLLADIYFNGQHLGSTQNIFLKYVYNVKNLLRNKDNVLQVQLHSTVNAMDNMDCDGYFGIFNTPRIFLRTIQCSFGWDWMPNLPSYGISGVVTLTGVSSHRIEDVTYRAHNNGKITLIAEVNYDILPTVDDYGVPIPNTGATKDDDWLEFWLETEPQSGVYEKKSVEMQGTQTFVNFMLEKPQLWWPNGYGQQPLYNYKVILHRGGKMISEKSGKCAFREVKLLQEPKTDRMVGFEFFINGVKVLAKGSNWIPADCFVGQLTETDYRQLVQLAKDGNMNMLRVWGGGLYEKDAFYDCCDELGIMVFQDFMFACSDLPENNPDWEANTLEECRYQLKRLRNHPSIVYWSGGNEKTGCCVHQIPKGDFFIDHQLTGLVARMDPTRPFGRQSPVGFGPVGNQMESGDTHHSSQAAAVYDMLKNRCDSVTQYRKLVNRSIIGFLSECAVFGPNSVQTTEKVYPKDKLWPLNEHWFDRMTHNPYDGMGGIPFASQLERLLTAMYGKPDSLESFVAKGMQYHAELLRTEIDWVRANQPMTGGILNWMFNDIWPCGTWAVVDYYREPKQVYYQMRRSFAPIYATFVENPQGQTELAVMNETGKPAMVSLEYGCRRFDGTSIEIRTVQLQLENGIAHRELVPFAVDATCSYLYTAVTVDDRTVHNVYSPDLWQSAAFDGTYRIDASLLTAHHAQIRVKATGFVKGLYISFPDNYRYRYSDNYLDMEDGEEKIVDVIAEQPIDLQQMTARDYKTMT